MASLGTKKADGSTPKLLKSVAQSTSYNIILQLMFRVLTFVLNAVVLRYVTKDLLGVVNVRLTLLYSTTLFIGREAFRKACLSKAEENVAWRDIINISWCCPVVGSIAAVILCYVWLYLLELPDPAYIPYYSYGVLCFGISAVLEMLSEPLFIVGQKLLYVRFKAVIEGVALLLKCLVTITLIILYPHMGLLAFCIAQLTFTVVYVGGYFIYFGYHTMSDSSFPFTSVTQFFPTIADNQNVINKQLARLTWSFLKQSFLKQLLTEGERYMMTMFSILSFADQGIFDIITNLGSLIARFFFLPLEESSYLLFSQSIVRGIPAIKQTQEEWKLATTVLIHLLKLVTIVGLTVTSFGYSYSQLALHIYGGQMLSSGIGPYLLKWYCIYVLALAINGITECFSFATMSKEAVDKYNYKMLGFSAGFLLASFVLTNMFGSAGFIMANCCNMLARIIHSIYVIEVFYTGTNIQPIKKSLIDLKIIIIFGICFLVTGLSQMILGLSAPILHITIGVVCLFMLGVFIYNIEQETVTFIYQKFIQPMIRRKTD